MAEDEVLLEVRNLNVSYGDSRVLFDVSLYCRPREVVAIVGRNGTGKTTLLKAIGGFLRPVSGSVMYKGQRLAGLRSYQVARMGLRYVPQDKRVFSDLTVRENLELASYATGDYDWERIVRYFPKLRELMDRKGGYLSGGERQMLMIGRALLGKPELLLLDEPTEGLAPSVVRELASAFGELRQSIGLVLVEQNLAVASQLADRVYVMKEGRIVAECDDRREIESLAFERYL